MTTATKTQELVAQKLSLFEMRQKREELFQQFFDGIIEQATFTDEQCLAIREVLAAKSEEALQKRDDIVDLLEAAQDEREALKRRRDAMDVRIKQFDAFEGSFRESLRLQMEFLGVKRVEGRVHRLLLREGKDSVLITNMAMLPAEFINYEPKADRPDISKALHEGKEVPGAQLVPAKTSLVIT